MCGLFAGVGKLSSNRMIALGSMNEERGTDSVGIAYIENNEMRIAKIAERPCVGLNITMRKEVTAAAVSGMFIGHTRAATQGTVTARNAHPFLDDGIAFAHNGIIMNDAEFGKYEVDSESLIHGIKARDFSKYKGPIALVWIQDGKLKAYRCGNPLSRGRHNGSTYLASEGDYLREIGCTHIKKLAEGLIYTFVSPFVITTEKVKKNQTYGSSYTSMDAYSGTYTGQGWENYLEKKWAREEEEKDNDKKNKITSLSIVDKDFPPAGYKAEDFRTPSDMEKELAQDRFYDNCDACGMYEELTEGMCLPCIVWMDKEGVQQDRMPEWLKNSHAR